MLSSTNSRTILASPTACGSLREPIAQLPVRVAGGSAEYSQCLYPRSQIYSPREITINIQASTGQKSSSSVSPVFHPGSSLPSSVLNKPCNLGKLISRSLIIGSILTPRADIDRTHAFKNKQYPLSIIIHNHMEQFG